MADDKKKITFWQRLRNKYRISVLNEETLTEHMHFRLNGWNAIVLLATLFVIAMGLFSLVILFTPVKNYLPGYSENIRQQLMEESTRVDSIGTSLELQRQYLDVIKQVVAGEVSTDTIQSLDSMQIIMREELLMAKSQAAEEFVAQYEAKEKDNMQLFDVANTVPVLSFFRPAHGVVVEPFSIKEQRYGVGIKTPEKENVTAVLAGTIVSIDYSLNSAYAIMIQHDSYLSVYRGLAKVLKKVGDQVQMGESVAIVGDAMLRFELWQGGKAINPEEVIAF